MRDKKAALFLIALLLIGMFALAFNVVPTEARARVSAMSKDEVLKYKPIVPPAPHTVAGAEDQTSMVGFDMVTKKRVVVPSTDPTQLPVKSGVTSTEPYYGVLQEGFEPESVIGPDDRSLVSYPTTTSFPWSSVCKLLITAADDTHLMGSGCIIGPGQDGHGYHVLTAGHCVYIYDHGGYASEIIVIPGYDGEQTQVDEQMPYGYAKVTYMRTYEAWEVSQDSRHDWAVPTDPIYTGVLETAGYPGDLDEGERMYYDSDSGLDADDYNHWYYMDTYEGQSGSPVWYDSGAELYILSIHCYGGSSSNMGTRLNQEKLDSIEAWISSDAPPPVAMFDFGSDSSPVELDFTPVSESTLYSSAKGYGWASISGLASRDRGAPDDLRRDLVQSVTEHTFKLDLMNGDYRIAMIMGDQSYMHDLIDVYAEDIQEMNDLTATAGEFQEVAFYTTVLDGQLNLRILDDGGADANWVINALTVKPGTTPTEAYFDFGTAVSPVEDGYVQVTEATLYSAFTGYGWTSTSGLASTDRGFADFLQRDFVQSTTEHTFNVDLANGDYQIDVIICDRSYSAQPTHDLIDVYAEDVQKINDLTVTPSAWVQEVTFYTTVLDGQLNLRILDDGGVDPDWVINALTVQPGTPPALPTEGYFDFGTAVSLVEDGYVQVIETTFYSASWGYGWTSTMSLSSRDRGSPDSLKRDLVQSTTEHTFSFDLANGDYEVSVRIGDQNYAHDLIDVYAEDVLEINDFNPEVGAFPELTFYTSITDNQLNLRILDDGGVDPNWVINALTVQPGTPPTLPTEAHFDFGPPRSPVALGFTRVSEVVVYSASTGYGWSSTSGLVSRDRIEPDYLREDLIQSTTEHTFSVDLASGDYAVTVIIGDQSYMHDLIDVYAEDVLVIDDLSSAAGSFQEATFYLTLTDEQLNLRILDDGGADANWVINGLTVQPGTPPTPPTEVAFDFGSDASPVEADYDKVTETTLYSTSTGYGWTSTSGLTSRDRGAPDDLRRDLIQCADEHTFAVDLANGDYMITLVVGDQSYMHDQIDVYAEDTLKVDGLTVATGEFQEVTFYTTVTDGQLNLRISDDGGVDANWVINALTIELVTTVSIPLYPGYNMISLPLQPIETNTEVVLAGLEGTILYWYNASEQDPLMRWWIWDDTRPPQEYDIENTLLTMETNKAYWLWVDDSQTLSYEGTQPAENTVQLYEGWNFVSFQTCSESIQNAMKQLTGFAWMYYYNASEPDVLSRWKIWDNTIPEIYWELYNTLQRIEPGEGYWLWVDTEQMWEEGSSAVGDLPTPSETYTPPSSPCTFWSRNGDSKLNGKPVPAGALITAYDSDGLLCGTSTVKYTGCFYICCIADNPSTPEDEGADAGDIISFYVNGAPCTVVGGSAEWQIGYQEVNIEGVIESFDFGTIGSPVEYGYTQVTEATLYSSATGYGWTNVAGLSSRDRGAPDSLKQDLVQSTGEHTFKVDLANGLYMITVVIGDQSYTHDLIDVYAENTLEINDLTVAIGVFQEVTFYIEITDEQFDLKILDEGGADGNWVINKLDIQMVG